MTKSYLLFNPTIEYQRGGKYTKPFLTDSLQGTNKIVITNEPLGRGAVEYSYSEINSITIGDSTHQRKHRFALKEAATVNVIISHITSGDIYVLHILHGVEWEVRTSEKN